MTLTPPLQAEHQLDQLAGQFEHWRQSRPQAWARIPESLWAQAVALAVVLPPARVAKQLRVKVVHLHRHIAAQQACTAPIPPAGFVEVPLPTPAVPDHGDLTVAFQRSDGARLSLHAPATTLPLLAIVQCFLEGRACSS